MNLRLKSSRNAKSAVMTHPLGYAELVPLADEVLMGRLRDGHHDALAVLFDRYHRLVLRIALGILHDVGEAEDLMQSVFLEIFRSAAQFDQARGTAKVWILQYAYHRSFNRRKYLNLRGTYERPENSVPVEKSPAEANTNTLGVLDSARAVRQALGRLNNTQRKIVELAFYEGLTMHEIAQTTGESFDSIRHHYYRGLEKLRSILCEASGTRVKASGRRGGPCPVMKSLKN
jgi:RNA polymerase sigma-70 factor (ECF subfamily)